MGYLRRRKAARLAELDAFRHVRRAADEDVTRFGEELGELHFETLTTPIGETMREDYQRALDAYEDAKARLRAATSGSDVTAVTRRLADGRFAHACVLAARDGRDRPQRRPPCFFDPAHGPASQDVEWAPPGGVPREVAVCFRDAERLTAGEAPDVRLVRLGNRRVAWYAAGPLYLAWASGWYDEAVREGRMDAERLTMAYTTGVGTAGAGAVLADAGWTDPGAWDSGGILGGHDYGGGWSGGHDSGWDFGGGDAGGGGDGGGGGGD